MSRSGAPSSVTARPQLSHLALWSPRDPRDEGGGREFERPCWLLFGGKDSISAAPGEKAFRPAPFPSPLMHVDTGHNFARVIEFRDRRVAEAGRAAHRGERAGLDRQRPRGRGTGPRAARPHRLQTVTLLDAIAEHGFDAAFAVPDATRSALAPRSASSPFRDDFGSGTQEPAPRAVEPLQRAHPPGRARARLPDVQLDRARRVGVRRPGGARGPIDLLRAPARGVQAR